MAKDKSIEFLDYLIILLKRKKFLIITFLSLLIVSYLFIYFFINEQYEATALIIPSQQEQLGEFSSILKDFSSLPFNLNIGGLSENNNIDLYTTIINSRTNLEKVVERFNLIKKYKVDNMEEAIKALSKKIDAEETSESAFEISLRADSPQNAADMTNYVVDLLNKTVIRLNVQKSKDNREFLGKRYMEIKDNLKNAEDSLKIYEQYSGIYAAEDQAKSVLDAYTKLETELAVKQIQLSIYKKIYGENSGLTNNANIEVKQFANKINELKKGDPGNIILGINSLPEKAINFLRYTRDVEIYEKMLEFILPLYEQAKFDEQKNIPILQVIDYAVPPVKRAYPKRVFSALLITVFIFSFIVLFIVINEIWKSTSNPKLIFIRKELFSFKKKDQG